MRAFFVRFCAFSSHQFALPRDTCPKSPLCCLTIPVKKLPIMGKICPVRVLFHKLPANVSKKSLFQYLVLMLKHKQQFSRLFFTVFLEFFLSILTSGLKIDLNTYLSVPIAFIFSLALTVYF